MVAMDREDWNGDVDIWVFVVDIVESAVIGMSESQPAYHYDRYKPRKHLTAIAKHFQLAGFFAQAVHSERSLDLEECFS